jgi:hypothetical protein
MALARSGANDAVRLRPAPNIRSVPCRYAAHGRDAVPHSMWVPADYDQSRARVGRMPW